MIHLGQSRAFSGVTLAAIVATACSGRVEREHPEPSGGAGAPVARVPGNSSIDDPSDGPSVGGRANSPSSGGVSGTWTAAGGAPVGVAGGAPVGVGAAGGAPIAGAPGCVASWAGAGAGGAWAGGLGSGGFGAACVPPVAANQVPLTPVDGWVDGASNPLAIQGALYAAADPRSVVSSDFMGSNVCMKGVTAKVDPNCTPIPPAADCQMTIWGAAIYLNLNQLFLIMRRLCPSAQNRFPCTAAAFRHAWRMRRRNNRQNSAPLGGVIFRNDQMLELPRSAFPQIWK